MGDKYTWGAETLLSQCIYCKHLGDGPVAVCAAFHGAIPAEILANEVDHRKPRIDPETGKPGDEGVLLAGSITFAFDDAITSAARETLTHYLDGLGA